MAKPLNLRFLSYMEPTVAAIRRLGNSARPKEVVAEVEAHVEVPPDDLTRLTKSGQTIFENQIHWCRAYLAKTGYIDSTQRGVWRLTERGKVETLTKERVDEIFREVQGRTPTIASRTSTEAVEDSTRLVSVAVDEVDVGEEAYKADVISRLRSLTPKAFEEFCSELLREADFESVEVTGRSGDSGIDGSGLLRINPLCSLKVVFQAKRYSESVGVGVVRDFRGASVGRADRGLLITTGTFTRGARDEAMRDGAMPIQLIDVEDIVELMVRLEFGLKSVQTFVVDKDFFCRFDSSK